jgi:hypothetical protein
MEAAACGGDEATPKKLLEAMASARQPVKPSHYGQTAQQLREADEGEGTWLGPAFAAETAARLSGKISIKTPGSGPGGSDLPRAHAVAGA